MDALAGVAHGHHVARQQQDGVGFFPGAAHTAAQLIEIRQAEAVGAVDEDGVGIGDIDAGLDDGGGKQDVGLALDEGVHDHFQLILVHLSVADEDARLRHQLGDAAAHHLDGFYPVVQEEHLAAALHFAADGVADDAFVIRANAGGNRHPVGRRGVNGGHVARSHQRHVKRARYGRGG